MPSSGAGPFSLITAVVSLLKHHRSKSRYHEISLLLSSSPTPLSPSQFSLITLSLRSSPLLALHFFHLCNHNSLFIHSLSSYSSLIHTLARSRKHTHHTLHLIQLSLINFPNQALALFNSLAKTYRVFDSAPVVFDLLIEAILRSKRSDLAAQIAKLLISQGNYPNIRTCNLLIKCFFNQNGSLIGFDLYKEVFSGNRIGPNVGTFNVILLAFYRDGLVGSLEGVWGEMGKRGIRPNGFSYRVLLTAYCEEGRMWEAGRAWEEMREKGLERDCVTYEAMIGGYCGIGEVGKAEELFREMELGGIEGSCASFEHLIKGYCEVKDLGSALLLYKDMCRRRFRPEGTVVDIVVRGLCMENRVLEGLEFFRVAIRKYEIVPKGTSFEVLIKGLCCEGMMGEALELQGEMVGKGFEPNLEIYKVFIDGYTNEGDNEMVRRLKKEMVDMKIVENDD